MEKYAEPSTGTDVFVVTVVTGDDKATLLGHGSRQSGIATYGCHVAPDGAVTGFSQTDFDRKEGSGFTIKPADFKRLNELLAKLPDDGSRLPPSGRRMIVETNLGARKMRVFDRANAPDDLLEVLRLSASGIRPWMPVISPRSKIDTQSSDTDGILRLSPDAKSVLFACTNGPLQIWDVNTHKALGEIRPDENPGPKYSLYSPIGFDALTLSPDGSLAILGRRNDLLVLETKTWKSVRKLQEPQNNRARYTYLDNPHFTPDGKFLVAECDFEPSLRIFDTRTWAHVQSIPDVPEDAVQYFPAPRSRRAVIRSKSGTVALWDLDRRAAVAQLDQGIEVSQVTFSPDESMVAVVITYDKPRVGSGQYIRLCVWKAGTGEFVHECRPYEQTTAEKILDPIWSPDGQYLLAATKDRDFFSSAAISVWNIRTGRQRGAFSGAQNIKGIALLPDGSQLIAGSTDGEILFWNFAAAMKQIRRFEDSLQPR